ncbi:MAG: hypothetical protein IPJ78_11335 [Gemmatimonadetes bacterium]|nr:hypothetical protein [Gemmatimonadota bacterium]
MRELADGRVIVLDEGDQRIVLLSSDLLIAQPLLRIGDGPGEYRRVGSLHALPGDTTLFVDSFNGRITILVGVRFVGMLSERDAAIAQFQQEVLGADRYGHLLGAPALLGSGRTAVPRAAAESLQLLLSSRQSSHVDSVGRMRGRGSGRVQMVREEGRAPFMYVGSPLSSQDEAMLFADGWIAIAHLRPYRVDWRDPQGRWLRGSPLEDAPTALTREHKCAAWQRIFSGTRPCRPELLTEWPSTLPPFLSSTSNLGVTPLIGEPNGMLAIRRTPSVDGERPRLDLVDRRSVRVRQLTLQHQESLLGFGKDAAYIVVTDDDGVQRVRRHEWK